MVLRESYNQQKGGMRFKTVSVVNGTDMREG